MRPQSDTSATVVLVRPKFEANVAAALRAAACFRASELIVVAHRYESASGSKRSRSLRPLRMKAYSTVRLRFVEQLTLPVDRTPVAVELLDGAESLHFFPHPASATYIFGPEDGSLDSALLASCHRFVHIPSEHCLNLGMAVGIVLYDRTAKALRGELL